MRYAELLGLSLAIAVTHTAALSLASINEPIHATSVAQTPPATSTKPASATDEDPEIAALPEPTRARAKKIAEQLMQSTNLAELRQRLKSIDAQVAQVLPEMKPLFDYVRKKVQGRIAQLEANDVPSSAISTKASSNVVKIAPTTIATTPTATAAAPTAITTTSASNAVKIAPTTISTTPAATAAAPTAITTTSASNAVKIAPTTIATTPTAPTATATAPTAIATTSASNSVTIAPTTIETLPAVTAAEPIAITQITTLEWADVLEQNPNPKVVTNTDLLARIQATGLPWRVKDKSAGIEMLLVPPGKFIMGASPGDTEATDAEKPAHEVTLTKPFYLGRTEITQAQWYEVTGEEAGHFKLSSEHPVESVTFENVNNFLKKAGNGLDLPTEAQWEYCCRAGTKGAAYGDLDSIAWYSNNSKNTTHAVAQALANEFGFYDMIGNVSEWCSDNYAPYTEASQTDPSGPANGTDRVLCGGHWFNYSSGCRASIRSGRDSNYHSYGIGFRVARNP